MYKRIIFFVCMLSLTFPISVFGQSSSLTQGLNYLNTAQNSDGSIGNITSTTDITRTTIAVVGTLQALSQTNTTLYSNAVSWLQSQSISTTDYLSERMFTLLTGGSDERLLVSYIDPTSGVWGGYAGYNINNLDTTLALNALNAVNYSNQATISNALLYLVTNQNSDGGWGFYVGDDSNVYMTALVLQVFDGLKATYNLTVPISNAAQYLLSHQNSDGGFGSSTSTVYETALSFLACWDQTHPLPLLIEGKRLCKRQSITSQLPSPQTAHGMRMHTQQPLHCVHLAHTFQTFTSTRVK